MAAPVIVRVGCALDGSVERTFGDLERRARRAGRAVERSVGRTGGQAGYGVATAARATERAQTAAVQQGSRERLRIIRQEARERAREHRSLLSEVARDERQAAARAAAQARVAARTAAREQRNAARDLDRFATRTSHRATRFLTPNMPLASLARRGASDIMRGMGIDTSISGGVSRSRDLERSSVALSTAGYQAGAQGPAGTRVDPRDLMASARQTADALALDPQSIIDANAQYVKLTGNLAEARDLQKQLAELSIATGSSLEDVAGAAGEASNALGDMPAEQKLGAIMEVLRGAASQGKIGSVEMEDFARYYAHLGGTAGQFGGPRAKTLSEFGALVQLSKKYGGATSAATATRSISGLGNTLSTPARRAQFAKFGVQLEDEKGMFRDPLEILKDSIKATDGNTEDMKKMWANVVGSKPAMALSNIYKGAGGGDAGMKAIEKELAEQLNASTMSQKAIDDAVARNAETAAAKAQKFQNQLDRITESAATKLIPALEKLAPTALKVADGLAAVVQWAAENPGTAITAAITASIARAGLESALRTGIETAIRGAVGTGGMGGISTASSLLTIAATAVTLYAAGQVLIDQGAKEAEAARSSSVVGDVQAEVAVQNAERLSRQGGFGQDTETELKRQLASLKEREQLAMERGTFTSGWRAIKGVFGAEGGTTGEQAQRAAIDAQKIDELRAQMARVEAVLANGLRVEVTNADAIRGPATPAGVDPSGRDRE